MPDWSRERAQTWFDPGRRLLAAHRALERLRGRRAPLRRRLAMLRHRLWRVIGQVDIAPDARIGGGLLLPHPNGIVIHPEAVIGPNCLIFQQVTIAGGRGGAPLIGGHVDIGAGARLLGGIVIGDHAVIGANAVVTQDVPPGATMVGIPARPLAR